MHQASWLLLLPLVAYGGPIFGGHSFLGGLKKRSAVPVAILPGTKGSIPPPPPPMIGPAPVPLPPLPQAPMPLMPPPISKGPDFIHLQPVVDHQVVVFQQEPAAILEEPVMLAPPPPPPQISLQMPPPASPYIPPTYIDLPAPQKDPVIIHATPGDVPAVPNWLPTKGGRGNGYYPVAVIQQASKGQFVRAGRPPSKEGPVLPNPPVHIRPAMKGEM